MATTKSRLNITLDKDLQYLLSRIAKRDRVPQATKAVALLKIALEIEEDEYWNALATQRTKEKTRLISHVEAWK